MNDDKNADLVGFVTPPNIGPQKPPLITILPLVIREDMGHRLGPKMLSGMFEMK